MANGPARASCASVRSRRPTAQRCAPRRSGEEGPSLFMYATALLQSAVFAVFVRSTDHVLCILADVT